MFSIGCCRGFLISYNFLMFFPTEDSLVFPTFCQRILVFP